MFRDGCSCARAGKTGAVDLFFCHKHEMFLNCIYICVFTLGEECTKEYQHQCRIYCQNQRCSLGEGHRGHYPECPAPLPQIKNIYQSLTLKGSSAKLLFLINVFCCATNCDQDFL